MLDLCLDKYHYLYSKDLKTYVSEILSNIGKSISVKESNIESYNFLLDLCKRHPSANEKLKNILDFQILQERNGYAIIIVNTDYTTTSISIACCISGKGTPTRQLFCQVLRSCITPQIYSFKKTADKTVCLLCNRSLLSNDVEIHIDHHEPQFNQIVSDFLILKKITIPIDYVAGGLFGEKYFKTEDKHIEDDFNKYHKEVAVLRVLCAKCNESRPHF